MSIKCTQFFCETTKKEKDLVIVPVNTDNKKSKYTGQEEERG